MMKEGLVLFALGATAAACGGEEKCDPEAPNSICTVAGNGELGYSADGVAATEVRIYAPQDTRIHNGELWLLDFNNYRIRVVNKAGIIRTEVGTGLLGESPSPGVERTPVKEALFNHTPSFVFHPDDGYLYLAAWHNSRIKRIRLSDMTLENYAGAGTRVLYAGDEGPAMMANLDLPSSVAVSPTGEVVVMDQANQVIRSIDKAGIIHRIAGRCIIESPTNPTCDAPSACSGSNAGKVVCGDPAVQCSLACTPGYGGDGGLALDARMAQPFGQAADPAGRIAYTPDGDLLFVDSDNNRIRKISNGMITTIAGTGELGYSGDGGPATSATLNHPVDVEVASDGTIYFTDVQNSCVRKIETNGNISTAVGQCSTKPADRGFEGDGGPALDAKLNRPYGIDLVDDKTLYVSDSYNHRIRRVNL